jgi:hypothetical protein
MIAGIYNIFCEQGTTFSRTFELQYPDPIEPDVYYDYDLTGFTARMQVRRTIESSTIIIELTTENGGIEIDGPEGRITVYMSASETEELSSSGVYDIEIIDGGGSVSRLVQGAFTLSLEVTR